MKFFAFPLAKQPEISKVFPMDNGLNPKDLMRCNAHEVASLVDIDRWTVRDEGERRAKAAEAKLARLRKKLAEAEKELKEANFILETANKAFQEAFRQEG